ncbi:ion channel domain-containing protein [Ditylenchus destructor]|uniref:Ion channel domain-containing protein n=1 Tax=Ditylenchus destructor TaxID=166010 RepID=A0AAD4RBA8_9BILA|nr:ion channel domain-containing protein [Ditylenchus destructor]
MNLFLIILQGGQMFISYEVDMDFFKALYFNYVTITTIGLGDIVPKNYNYLYFTFIYITVGLALTTMAVEIAADYLKKLHYFGRKVGNVAKQDVWFGGKKMKLKNLIRHLGDQLNIPIEELENLNIDSFVQSAIQVVDGEKETLRKPPTGKKPISFEDLRKEVDSRNINYADE